ncbi:hypothetical protein [Larkinella soli]|uniref:hypothetical protein n=1 Tax=Larkinella soli TaxID=1770527 RepID=UPI000FFB8C06|nr:hypothetical protein [Larkinella soli]
MNTFPTKLDQIRGALYDAELDYEYMELLNRIRLEGSHEELSWLTFGGPEYSIITFHFNERDELTKIDFEHSY